MNCWIHILLIFQKVIVSTWKNLAYNSKKYR
jgi:hypothetical protein